MPTHSSETHYDAVIVGSGFGGSVMAYRLAAAGLRVCVLERGKRYRSGSFPRAPHEMRRNFWDPSEGLYGLFHMWWFRHVAAITASGLGGGSLVYANVLLRKEEDWFLTENSREGYKPWMVNRAELDCHYDNVETMLGATPYPFHRPPYNQTSKTQSMQSAAENLGLGNQWFLPNLAITFAGEGEELGAPLDAKHYPTRYQQSRQSCRLCGECYLGCNYGSKNTLDFNYLYHAEDQGAEIKTLSEVRSFKPLEKGGYAIRYVQHQPDQEGRALDTQDPSVLPLQTLTANRLILAAGTFGSTYLLLKMKAAGTLPHLSSALGTKFSGNGDLLKFVTQATEATDEAQPRFIDNGYGPAITSAIRFPDRSNSQRNFNFFIQDVGYPEFLSWVVLTANTPRSIGRLVPLLKSLLRRTFQGEPETDISAELTTLLTAAEIASRSLPMLAVGHDVPDGRMVLSKQQQKLKLDWRKNLSRPYFQQAGKRMLDIASQGLGGKLSDPLRWLGRPVTGHPLGGCPMGKSAQEGVVDAYGEVFNYPGLYVSDGSVLPGPVGVNPSLTIAALADRFAERIIEQASKR